MAMNFSTTVIRNATEIPWKPFFNIVTNTKIGMAIGLLISVFIVTLLPYFVVKRLNQKMGLHNRKSKYYKIFTTWMSRINCFAGGVFLSTGFMDIFPEMMESIEEAKKKNNIENKFPLGPFLTLLGFFMILIIEESVTFIKTTFYAKTTTNKITPHSDQIDDEVENRTTKVSQYNAVHNDPENTTNNGERGIHDHSIDHTHHEHHEHGLDAEALSRGNLSVTILMIAISVHSIFEGLALGLEKDTSGAYRLFLALCLHKYIIAITIGLQVSKSTLGIKMSILCSGIFAFATPFGVALGFWVAYLQQSGDKTFSMVAGVLQGMACGTFFYIVFFEILPEEFGTRHDKVLKILALILGFGLVSLVMLFIHE